MSDDVRDILIGLVVTVGPIIITAAVNLGVGLLERIAASTENQYDDGVVRWFKARAASVSELLIKLTLKRFGRK